MVENLKGHGMCPSCLYREVRVVLHLIDGLISDKFHCTVPDFTYILSSVYGNWENCILIVKIILFSFSLAPYMIVKSQNPVERGVSVIQ